MTEARPPAAGPRVTHVITGLNAGGAERMLSRIVRTARRAGREHNVISLSGAGVFGEEIRASGAQLEALGLDGGAATAWRLALLPRMVRRQRPDVLMTWLYHADVAGLLAGVAAGLHPRRVVWNIRCSNVDLGMTGRTTRLVVALAGRLSRAPGAVAANAIAGMKHHETLGYRPRRWIYLPNGIDLDLWRPDENDRAAMRKELGLAPADVVVGMVARVDPQKDHECFFAAAARLAVLRPGLRFLLAGEGTADLDAPEALAGRVITLGRRADIPRIMRAMDLHALSSAYGEGFPNVLCEAMATGVPCVATDVGDAAAILGESGVIVPPRSPAALADAVLALIDGGADARAARGAAGRARVVAHYGLAEIERRYAELFAEISGAAQPGPTSA